MKKVQAIYTGSGKDRNTRVLMRLQLNSDFYKKNYVAVTSQNNFNRYFVKFNRFSAKISVPHVDDEDKAKWF